MFNLSTLSGINLQTDNYFQYTSNRRLVRGEPWHVYPEIFLRYAENAWKLSMFSGAELYVSRPENVGFRPGKPMVWTTKT